jgi:hypothetical protein
MTGAANCNPSPNSTPAVLASANMPSAWIPPPMGMMRTLRAIASIITRWASTARRSVMANRLPNVPSTFSELLLIGSSTAAPDNPI